MGGRTTRTESGTRIRVEVRDGRHQLRTRGGLLRAQRLHSPVDRVRVALVGQTALLLGGDEVSLDVEVGAGARLQLCDIAGTVAYHGRGRPASWQVTIRLEPGARLDYAGEPFVISDGADVTRTLEIDLAVGAGARLRDTLVLGRAGETGGRLDATTVLRRAGQEFCRERWVLEPATRGRPGVLAGVRVLDSVLDLGGGAPEQREGGSAPSEASERCPTSFSIRSDVVSYALVEPGSTVTRFMGTTLADSPLG